jgi:phosphoribosyl-ATP pyrophosphohydrolase
MPKKSYTAYLFKKGLTEICAKVAEESAEVIKAAKKESKKRVIEESVDVLYHLFVLTAQRGVKFADLMREITKRRK